MPSVLEGQIQIGHVIIKKLRGLLYIGMLVIYLSALAARIPLKYQSESLIINNQLQTYICTAVVLFTRDWPWTKILVVRVKD